MCVVGVPEETYTYDRMLAEIRAVSTRLKTEGIGKGDRVAVFGENHPCWAVAYLAVLYAEAVCVPIDPHGEIETVSNFIEDSEAKAVFISPNLCDRVAEIEERLGRKLKTIAWRCGKFEGVESFEDWASKSERGAPLAPATVDTDNALLIYTSGTTGKPKGVLLTHGNICAELDAIDNILEISEEERILSLLPLFHAYLQIAALWIASTKGCEVFYLKELTPDELSKAMMESRMTIFASVPRLWYLFHKRIFDEVRKQNRVFRVLFRFLLRTNGFLRDLIGINAGKVFFGKVHRSFGGSLRLAISAGSRFDEDVAIDFHRIGFTILQGYGLTETSGAATATHINDNRVGSVGKPVLRAEVKIGDSDEKGEGEVLIRGPMVFGGYYRNPEATKESFTEDGWFRSGDLGRFDHHGHLYITGRAKDVIVLPSGKNVHPEDLEVHYLKSPLVAELCVVGVEDRKDEHKGAEKLAAVAVPDFEYLKQHKIANAREAIRFSLDDLGRELPEYQRVRDYVVRSEPLPRTATNKIKRFELRAEINRNGSGSTETETMREWTFSADDESLASTSAAQHLAEAVSQQNPEAGRLHPKMNLEIDLRLDSLARAEIFARLEEAFGFEFAGDDVAKALTVGDVVSLVAASSAGSYNASNGSDLNWNRIVHDEQAPLPEAEAILKDGALFAGFTFLVLKAFHLFCRVFLRMKVTGASKLKEIDGPFLICPNHQSYLDPFVVCSNYPYSVLKRIFHVGASEYFQGAVMGRLAGLLNVVPIDPDTQLLKAMRAGAAGLRRGRILNIYPEGERAFDGDLHPFKNGAAILSTELQLPIVPVAIDGLHKVWARRSNKIRFAPIKVRFGDPILPERAENRDSATYSALTGALKLSIAEMLKEMRAE